MIRTIALTKEMKLIDQVPIERLSDDDIKWFWMDLVEPTEAEAEVLTSHFGFHPLAIEDCYHVLQRPKMDYYEGYDFFVFHTLNPETLESGELDVFLGTNYLVTYQIKKLGEVESVRQKLFNEIGVSTQGVISVFYMIMDKIVDEYFPIAYQIEDEINEFENRTSESSFIDELYEIRHHLLRLRRTIFPMRELTYRIINSEKLLIPKDQKVYFVDIHDHLLRLTEMIDSSREITSDIRDSYHSISASRMNKIMMTLTLFTTVFMPLTFIAGVYGMNFHYMPELEWKYGYFIALIVMVSIGLNMFLWFKSKGWLKL
jgi:magnesium transporter